MRSHAAFELIDPYMCVWGGVTNVVTNVINCAKFRENPSKGLGASRPEKWRIPLTSFIALITVSALPCHTVIN